MEDYSRKKAATRPPVPRNGSSLVLRDTGNNRNQNSQYCNRLRCSGGMNSTKGTQFGVSEKPKPSFRFSTGKEKIIGNPSTTSSPENSPKKPSKEPRKKLSCLLESDSSRSTTSVDHEPEISVLNPALEKIEINPKYIEAGSSSVASSTRTSKNNIKKSGLSKHTLGKLVPSKTTSREVTGTSSSSKYGLRNLKCNSISDVVQSGGLSSSDLSHNKKKSTVVTKKNCDGESSSSMFKGKKMVEPSFESRKSSISRNGISISESRRTKKGLPSSENASLRTARSFNGNRGLKDSSQGHGAEWLQNESADGSNNVSYASSSHQNSSGTRPRNLNNHSSRPGSSSSRSSHSRFPTSPEVGITRALINQDSFQRYNLNGITEMLLALERIEHDGELAYEQLLALETNLFLNGLNFHDQHRDMRLDIDNMSYEELLALEDKIGSVSTALPEEALEKCLKTTIYKSTPPKAWPKGEPEDENNDDVKCSICQEEYSEGDEVGSLKCEHNYHLDCVHQWLRLKNWCPICKISAAPS